MSIILVHSGWSTRHALLYNLASALTFPRSPRRRTPRDKVLHTASFGLGLVALLVVALIA